MWRYLCFFLPPTAVHQRSSIVASSLGVLENVEAQYQQSKLHTSADTLLEKHHPYTVNGSEYELDQSMMV